MADPIPASPSAGKQRSLFGALCTWLWNMLALAGLVGCLGGGYLYWQGQRATAQFEPNFLSMAGDFVQQTLQTDVASALAVRIPLKPGVSAETALESMKLRANKLNIPLINHYSMRKAVEKRTGKPARPTEILEFCDVEVAYAVLEHNIDYLAHMPCRIALHQDAAGRLWVLTMNMNLLIHGSKAVAPQLKIKALSLQDALLDIMAAGAAGDL